ncbi:Hypothetical predicted protein, partial [Paramuricea clavata]
MELGYDDQKQLLDMQPEEIIDVLKEVVLYDKSGHQCHRKQFVSGTICNRNFEFEDQTWRTFPPKVMQRNNARENARACDVTKIITSGRIKYESLENGAEKISQVD